MTKMHMFALAVGLALLGCSSSKEPANAIADTGNPGRGAALIAQYGCGSCHVIPQIEHAHGTVGPPLKNFVDRVYVAGTLINDVDNLTRWIRKPSAVNPGTAMPDLGLTESEARDVVAYLYAH